MTQASSLAPFAELVQVDDCNEVPIKVVEVYKKLQKDFEVKTGLTLEIRYHNSDDGADEVDGVFWSVNGVYQLTPAGQKWKTKIERKFWTTFG